MRERELDVLVIGSGAAGLAAAVRLDALGVRKLAVYSEGLDMGTSINTGSDKQTYYKLGMYGAEADSPVEMARDLAAGGSMHGDIALVEAALSPLAFSNLVMLGVPFPHDEFGQYIGYKTDHDPKRRATSCGPYTSRDMCRALIAAARGRGIEFCERQIAVSLLTLDGACLGAVFLDPGTGEAERVCAKYTVFAVGGPGGLYEESVYPAVHTGAIGLALEAGAMARNLAESQFGLASTKFRWNLSGSYMQVLPRFLSRSPDGTQREFLREHFNSDSELFAAVFLKGYQWPFAAGHFNGSSVIDVLVHGETARGGRVFLDYTENPAGYDFSALPREAAEYLAKSGAAEGKTPFERLKKLNEPAIRLYREHGIDPEREMLELAVCAQHCNGGLAGTVEWESENLRNLFPVGEVNGSHGVTRPGGSALNAGQCGAIRAAETIAGRLAGNTENPPDFQRAECAAVWNRKGVCTVSEWRGERKILRKRMSACGAFLRREPDAARALAEALEQWRKHRESGFDDLSPRDHAEVLRNEQLLAAQVCMLDAILTHIRTGAGSRGGAVVLSEETDSPVPENPAFRKKTLETRIVPGGKPESEWAECRPIPEPDGWFENVWRKYRESNRS